GPQRQHLATRHSRRAHSERDVELPFSDERGMLAKSNLGNLQNHIGMSVTERPYQRTEKARCHRREDPNTQITILAATSGFSSLDRVVKLDEHVACPIKKACTRVGNLYAAMVPFEQ